MHIAVNGWFWHQTHTGSGQYVRWLVHTLSALHTDVKLTVLLPTEEATPPPSIPNLTMVHHPTSPSNLSKVWWEQVRVPRFAREAGADLLHVPYWAPPISAPMPVVTTVHDLIPLILPAYRGSARVRLYTALVASATSNAALVITDSYAARNDIIQHLNLPPDRIRTVHLAADPVYGPEPGPQDAEIQARWGLASPYILYLGGFDVRKNVETALRAFAQAGQAIESTSLVIAGKLPKSNNAITLDPRHQMKRIGMDAGPVKFLGYVEEEIKPALYRGASAFIFPSRYEGFGLPPLEALSCGVPVVGSEASSLPEVVGRAGILLPPDDAEGMAGALIQLLTDEPYYQTLKAEARKQAAQFSWEKTAQRTVEAYQAALV